MIYLKTLNVFQMHPLFCNSISASVLGFLCTYSPIPMEGLEAEWQKAKLWEVHGEYFKEHAGHLWGTRINNSDCF